VRPELVVRSHQPVVHRLRIIVSIVVVASAYRVAIQMRFREPDRRSILAGGIAEAIGPSDLHTVGSELILDDD
jgi:hypothetical protein